MQALLCVFDQVIPAFLLASNLFFNLSTHAIPCTNFFQFEYVSTLMTLGVTTIASTSFVLLRSLSTSSTFASGSAWGHCSFGQRKNSGPVCHLSDNFETAMPRETLFATFCSPAICFHWAGSLLLWISPRRAGACREVELCHPLLFEIVQRKCE